MARNIPIRVLRTTRENLVAQGGEQNLIEGELYYVTDERRLAAGHSNEGAVTFVTEGQSMPAGLPGGIVSGARLKEDPGEQIDIPLDGCFYMVVLEDDVETSINTHWPNGAFGSALIRVVASPNGTGRVNWPNVTAFTESEADTSPGGVTDYVLFSYGVSNVTLYRVGGDVLVTGDTPLVADDVGVLVQGFDEQTAKLDAVNDWESRQNFGIVTGGVAETVTDPGDSLALELDGRIHPIDLADDVETVITATPLGDKQSYATVRLKGSPDGTGTISWASDHVLMTDQALNGESGKWTDYVLTSHDGSTVFVRAGGVQQS